MTMVQIGKVRLLTVFGGTSDVMHEKIIPALDEMEREGRLPDDLIILAVSRSEHTDATYIQFLADKLKAKNRFNAESWAKLSARIRYVRGDISKPDSLTALKLAVMTLTNDGTQNSIFYCAIAPELFGAAADAVDALRLPAIRYWQMNKVKPADGLIVKLMVEKPFAVTHAAGKLLAARLAQIFPNEWVCLVDHYLGNPGVILGTDRMLSDEVLRTLVSPHHVSGVRFIAEEQIGGNGRPSYVTMGQWADMGGHLLMAAAQVLSLDARSIGEVHSRASQLAFLQSVVVPRDRGLVLRAQYGAGNKMLGFLEEGGVDPSSTTETWASVVIRASSSRLGENVPVLLRTGKGLDQKRTGFAFTLRHQESAVAREFAAHTGLHERVGFEQRLKLDIHPFGPPRKTSRWEGGKDSHPMDDYTSAGQGIGQLFTLPYANIFSTVFGGSNLLCPSVPEALEVARILEAVAAPWHVTADASDLLKYARGTRHTPEMRRHERVLTGHLPA